VLNVPDVQNIQEETGHMGAWDLIGRKLIAKTQHRLKQAETIVSEFEEYWPMTVRQVFYQFVAREWIDNDQDGYNAVQYTLLHGRVNNLIDWKAVTDTSRETVQVQTWPDAKDFADDKLDDLGYYLRDLMQSQKVAIELWLEKSALVHIVGQVTRRFRIPSAQVADSRRCRSFTKQPSAWRLAARKASHVRRQTGGTGRPPARSPCPHCRERD